MSFIKTTLFGLAMGTVIGQLACFVGWALGF